MLRVFGLFLGIVVLIWLPIEESSVLGVLLISTLICSWMGTWLLYRTSNSNMKPLLRYLIIGSCVGLLIAPMALLLMAIKSGIHGHGRPDYTFSQMQSVISRIPFFVAGGLMVAAGAGVLANYYQVNTREPEK
jgi:uncharacterized BrkB/YihY/UPF0761 family membrane protein